MKGRELMALTRRDLDDEGQNQLWKDHELAEYMVDAENEACRRARLIVDTLTDRICNIKLNASESHYKLDSRIIFIRRVKLSDYAVPIKKMRLRDLDQQYAGWESQTGLVRAWTTGYSTGYLTVFRKPDAQTYPTMPSIRLTVVRLPLADATPDAELEIHERHQRNLRHWMKFRAYSKEDGDTWNPQKAKLALDLFEAEFGPPSPAMVEEFIDQQYDYEDEQGLY